MICKDVVVIDSLRTPVGSVGGGLSHLQAPQLGAPLIGEMIERYPLIRDNTENIIIGNSVSAGIGQNPARQTALLGGINPSANAFTVNQVCGSGMSVVGLSRALMLDQGTKLAIAGAIESCSNMPFLIERKNGNNINSPILVDSLYQDGLNCAIEEIPMGEIAEDFAHSHSISRMEQDEFALESHMKAARATREGWYKREILPVKDGRGGDFCLDENIREKTNRDTLSRLKPVYRQNGTVTAGNTSGLGDCAALILLAEADFAAKNDLKPMVHFLDTCCLGTPLKSVFSGGAQVLRTLLSKNNLRLEEIDVFEICESFACTVLGFLKETGIPRRKVNLYGGDIALGHPVGASGARVLTTLTHVMVREEKRVGIAIMSMGGGHSIGVLLERIP